MRWRANSNTEPELINDLNFLSDFATSGGLDRGIDGRLRHRPRLHWIGDRLPRLPAGKPAALADGVTVSHVTVGNEEYGSREYGLITPPPWSNITRTYAGADGRQ